MQDEDEQTRREAIAGLAKRGDLRMLDLFLREMNNLTVEDFIGGYCTTIRDTAEDIAENVMCDSDLTTAKKWLPALQKYREIVSHDDSQIDAAIARCIGGGRARAEARAGCDR